MGTTAHQGYELLFLQKSVMVGVGEIKKVLAIGRCDSWEVGGWGVVNDTGSPGYRL
jgi:hypothetical protein